MPVCLSIKPFFCQSHHLSVHPSIRLSVYWTVCLLACLSFCLLVCLSVCLYVFLSASVFVCLSVCHPNHPSMCQSNDLSACLSVYLSVYLSVCQLSVCVCQTVCINIEQFESILNNHIYFVCTISIRYLNSLLGLYTKFGWIGGGSEESAYIHRRQ
jgi:hypothetical protein